MKRSHRVMLNWLLPALLLAAFFSAPPALASVCSEGVAEPPFLSYGTDVKPNLLLMIDNSASMYDLAYDDLDEPGFCNDDSYIYPANVTAWANRAVYGPKKVVSVTCNDGVGSVSYWFRTSNGGVSNGTLCTDRATCGDAFCYIQNDTGVTDWVKVPRTYAGYFETDSWYKWNSGLGKFIEIDSPAAAGDACSAISGTKYTNSDVCVIIDGAVSPKIVRDFAASGNFLNWVAASNFDIQKSILTGGKYTGTAAAGNLTLIGESRGCLNRRMVRQVAVSSGATSYYLSLAVRAEQIGVDWTSVMEIFEVTGSGFQFDGTACEAAVEATQFGQVQNLAGDCLKIGQQNESFANSNAAFNHGFQTCWGYPTVAVGDISRMQQACQKVYDAGVDPRSISLEDSGYVCMGNSGDSSGYIGRCITGFQLVDPECVVPIPCAVATNPIPNNATEYCGPDSGPPGSLIMWECPFGFKYHAGSGSCRSGNESRPWEKKGCAISAWNWVANASVNLPDDNLSANPDQGCIERAIRDYCADYYDPGVIDPVGPVETLAENKFPNLPAILTGVALNAQLGEPLAAYKVRIHAAAEPTGLLHQKRDNDNLRLGLMTFNSPNNNEAAEGTKSECTPPNVPHRLYNCSNANRDGGKILASISEGAAHFNSLISQINAIKAKTWTPYAEAYFDILGYYTQDADRFWLDEAAPLPPDPINFWCQNNYVLILTDGASTADRNARMTNFVESTLGAAATAACGDFHGSTYLDDLTRFAWQADPPLLYGLGNYQLGGNAKKNIKTHIVAMGNLRVTGNDQCSPDVLLDAAASEGGTSLYTSEDAATLEKHLNQIFQELESRSSAGSAASVISSSRGGEGAIYQAIFWPQREADGDTITWVGEVHALFVNDKGHLYEDTNGDGRLDPTEDKRVVIYFDEESSRSRVCYGGFDAGGACTGGIVEVEEVRYLWSANNWLAKISNPNFPLPAFHVDDVKTQRDPFISNKRQRYIFTWNDLNNNGIVDSGEVLPLVSGQWEDFAVSNFRGSVIKDFNASSLNEVRDIIEWIRGHDEPENQVPRVTYRSRQTRKDLNRNGELGDEDIIIWRLGDVIHSTPMVVSRPAEGYHLIYGDSSYGAFVQHYMNRRHMIYFGGNDGMLHAVNGGFYNETTKKFCRSAACTPNEADLDLPELGAELWAYVPYNLLPHLKCLTSPGYSHKYYVDQRPRMFDVKIFPDDQDHPGGWGTILVGGMRFGGHEVNAAALNGMGADKRVFTSAYFILDITNPEKPPTLLGEFTYKNDAALAKLGYSTPIPSVVIMKDDNGNNEWYLILGSGPTTVRGESTMGARLAILPLKNLVGGDAHNPALKKPFNFPEARPLDANGQQGIFSLAASPNGFVSDLVTVDFNLAGYHSDAVYFGTVEGSFGNWNGKMYRMVTRDFDGQAQKITTPEEWHDLWPKAGGNYAPLLDAGQPIVASPAAGYDGRNFWIYFGTGRFYDAEDKNDNQIQSFYGIKEPMGCNGDFTWDSVLKNQEDALLPGRRGLLRVDQMVVRADGSRKVECREDELGNQAPECVLFLEHNLEHDTIDDLIKHIAGTGCTEDGTPTGIDGWYRNFLLDRERNLGQAALLGGLLTFTTYQPFSDPCLAEGLSSLYGIYYQTGTAWHRPIFGTEGGVLAGMVVDRVSLGRGLSTTPNIHVGSGEGAKAFVQTSTGEIQEIEQTELPLSTHKTGRRSWREVQ